MNKIKFAPNQWQRILNFTVYDPDGWDRTSGNFTSDWMKPLTFDEFMDKAEVSTCSSHKGRETLRRLAQTILV